jgi:hypothetical protein
VKDADVVICGIGIDRAGVVDFDIGSRSTVWV